MKNKPEQTLSDEVTVVAFSVADDAQEVVDEISGVIENTFAPVRDGLLKRYPALFLLAVTFGVSITFFGLDQVLSQSELFSGHPWLSLLFGIGILMATGTLYKKLG